MRIEHIDPIVRDFEIRKEEAENQSINNFDIVDISLEAIIMLKLSRIAQISQFELDTAHSNIKEGNMLTSNIINKYLK